MSVYQSAPDAAPDSDFEPGSLHHLVAGNSGRLLDPRRTPVSVVEVRAGTGFVILRIEGFEDAGATWQVPLEDVGHYQFARDAKHASTREVDEMRDTIERFDRELVIEVASSDRRRSEERIRALQADADAWLIEHSGFLAEGRSLPDPATRRGDGALATDLERYMRERALWEIEAAFAKAFVSNPNAGEVVKGHRITLATLGLAAYAGTIVRDPATFSAGWAPERRAEHILARLAFLGALFARLEIGALTLWRGLASEAPLRTSHKRSFVSVSFAEAVARSHLDSGAGRPTRALVCQSVPVERLFMTYLETAAMNDRFLEAEAVLLARPDDGWP